VEAPGWRLPSTRSAAMVRRHWEAQLLSTDDAVSLIASACAADDAGGPTMTALSSMAIPCRNVRHWARSSAALPPLRPARVTATLASRIAACMAVIVSASSVGSRLPVSAPKLRQPGRGNLQPHLSLTVRRGRHHEPSLLDDTLGRIARQSRASILPRDDSWRLPKLAVANRTRDREAGGRQRAVPMGVMNAQTVSNCTTGQVSVRVMPWTA
jgi:hypothetical protein